MGFVFAIAVPGHRRQDNKGYGHSIVQRRSGLPEMGMEQKPSKYPLYFVNLLGTNVT